MSSFVLSCLTYLCVALPGSTLGMLWPSMRLSLHEPVGALGQGLTPFPALIPAPCWFT
jgi:hypothetical protein